MLLNRKINKGINFIAKPKKEDIRLRKLIRFKGWKMSKIYMIDFFKKKKNSYCQNNWQIKTSIFLKEKKAKKFSQ